MLELTLSLFYAFAAILVFAALRVITARNPVHAVLYLVLSFFSAAAMRRDGAVFVRGHDGGF